MWSARWNPSSCRSGTKIPPIAFLQTNHGASFDVAFFGGRFTSLKLGAFFFSNFDQLQKLGERMTLRFPHGFEGRFTPQKKRWNKLHLFIRWQAHCGWIRSFGRMCLRIFGIQHFQSGRIPKKKTSCQGGVEFSPRWVALKRHPSWKRCAKSSNWGRIFPQQTTREVENFPPKSLSCHGSRLPGYHFSPARMRSYSERVTSRVGLGLKANFENTYLYIIHTLNHMSNISLV